MTREEFQSWQAFYMRWPFDDFHRYHRPAALVSVSMGGGEIQSRLDYLQPPFADKEGADRDLWMLAARSKRK